MTPEILGVLDFDPAALAPVLRVRLGESNGRYRLERIAGGQSNPSYFLDWGPHRLVLRKQPSGPILRGAHAIDREYRVLSALSPTGVPVPEPVLYHADPADLGTQFYLMKRLEGRVFTDTALSDLPAPARRPIWMAVADTLAAMHALRPDEVGLGDYGKPGNYFERQLARWHRQYAASPSGPLPQIEDLHDWLVVHLPEDDGRVTLTHGDFRLGNLIFHPTEPRVIGILDWELSTLGHPMADLGFCVMPWHSTPEEYGGLLGHDLDAMLLPREQELANRYAEAAGEDLAFLPFHKAFALYRFAVIFIGISDRARAGSAADPDAARFAPLARRFAERGLELAQGREHAL
jgi:aminoglycoside phosphotransferase (APT) family kinase protein